MFSIYTLSLAFFCVFVKCVPENEKIYRENFITSEGFWRDEDLQDRIDIETPLHLPVPELAKDQTSRLDVGGIIGSLGLKKGASLLGLIVFPLLLPFFLIFGFLLFFLFLFISIGATSGTAVSTGRRIASNMANNEDNINSVYQNILNNNDECIEKISCEIMKRLKTNKSKELLIGVLEKLTSNAKLVKRISLAAYSEDCIKKYSCDWKTIALRIFNVANQ